MIEIKFLKTHEDSILPKKNHDDDACYDLFAIEDTLIPSHSSSVVNVGLKLADISTGYWLKFENRSGNSFKKGLIVLGGIIDEGYRGEMGVKLYNTTDKDQYILKGNGAAQFSIQETKSANIEFTNEISQSERLEKGFGSSDK